MSGHRQIRGIVARDLQEDAGIRAALVGLPGGVKEARPEAEARGHALFVANRVANRLKLRFVRVVHLDVAEQREVIAGVQAIQMRAQIAGERGVVARRLFQGRGVLLVGERA